MPLARHEPSSLQRGAGLIAVAATALAASLAPAPSAQAATTTKCTYKHWASENSGYWMGRPIPFYLNMSTIPSQYNPGTVVKRVVNAANTWHFVRNKCHFRTSGHAPALQLATTPSTTCPVQGQPAYDTCAPATVAKSDPQNKDGQNTVAFGSGTCGESHVVLACTYPRPGGGNDMAEFDTTILPGHPLWFGLRPPDKQHYDFWSVVAHEFGHGLGFLSIGNNNPHAPQYVQQQVMYYGTFGGDSSHRYLGGGDYTALCTTTGC